MLDTKGVIHTRHDYLNGYKRTLFANKSLLRRLNISKNQINLASDNSLYAYTFVLVIDGRGAHQKGLTELKRLTSKYPDKSQLKELGLYFVTKIK